jgi:cytoskeletal protein CcmA (bactofilin family)
MFSKPNPNPSKTPQAAGAPAPSTPQPPTLRPGGPAPEPPVEPKAATARSPRGSSLIAADMTLEGNISGGGEIQIDGTVKGEVRVERVTVGESGEVDGGIYAEAVEIRGKVSGSVAARQVRLHGACDVDADIHHEQLAMEPGASFQGRSLRLQRAAPAGAAPGAPLARAPEIQGKSPAGSVS